MTKEEMIGFIRDNYCDIESDPLPKLIGELPSEIRLLKKTPLERLINKARASYGDKFAEFLENSISKGSIPRGRQKLWFFWLDFDNCEYMFKCWQASLQNRPNE
jgi:hypothetical protein